MQKKTPVRCSSCNKRIEHYPGYCEEDVEQYRSLLLELFDGVEDEGELCDQCHHRIHGSIDLDDIHIEAIFGEHLEGSSLVAQTQETHPEIQIFEPIIDTNSVEFSQSNSNNR